MNRPEALIRLLPSGLHWHPDGEIRLVGHRIGLYHVISYYNRGYAAEMLRDQFPTLDLDLIHQVIAFYRENQADVDAYMADVQAEINQFRAAHQPGTGILRLRERMEQRARAGEPS
jgi:uncharacterized protein (DUF433 family)